MIHVREPNFSLDLPGDWESQPGLEPSSTIFRQLDGPGVVTVMLLGVRPMFQIADQHRLLDDYMKHRSTFEAGPAGRIVYDEMDSQVDGDVILGTWTGHDLEVEQRFLRHHVVLRSGLLVDFLYEATGADADEFDDQAMEIFSSASTSLEDVATEADDVEEAEE